MGTNRIKLNVIPSRDRRVIKKWDWLVIRFNVAIRGSRNTRYIMELYIELREISIFDLQDRCLLLAFNSSDNTGCDFWHPKPVFWLNYYLCMILNISLAWKANVFNYTTYTVFRGNPILLASITCFRFSYLNLEYNYYNY